MPARENQALSRRLSVVNARARTSHPGLDSARPAHPIPPPKPMAGRLGGARALQWSSGLSTVGYGHTCDLGESRESFYAASFPRHFDQRAGVIDGKLLELTPGRRQQGAVCASVGCGMHGRWALARKICCAARQGVQTELSAVATTRDQKVQTNDWNAPL